MRKTRKLLLNLGRHASSINHVESRGMHSDNNDDTVGLSARPIRIRNDANNANNAHAEIIGGVRDNPK